MPGTPNKETAHSLKRRIGQTQIICNPLGYYPSAVNPSFDAELALDTGSIFRFIN